MSTKEERRKRKLKLKKPKWKVGDKAFVIMDNQIHQVEVTETNPAGLIAEIETRKYGLFEITPDALFKTADECRKSIKVVL